LAKKRKLADEEWQIALSEHIKSHIFDRGYVSEYDFWIQECGEEISRANLNNILNGKVDPKSSTLRKIAESLGITMSTLVKGVENKYLALK
tara:strand:- start:1954 stop:2226 length:273 start_codon:yes stop_codon:yes gene_type:complete